MEDNKELQEFDLDDILSEFQDEPETGDDLGELSEDLNRLMGSWMSDETAVREDDSSASDEAVQEEVSAAPMDTIRMNQLIAEIIDQSENNREDSAADTIRMDSDALHSIRADREETVAEGETIKMEAILRDATVRLEEVSQDDTIRLEEVSQDDTIRLEEVSQDDTIRLDEMSGDDTIRLDTKQEDTEEKKYSNIVYNPRTRLRELKRKLVAGPEKRYYELSEVGVGWMQASIGLNLLIVILCGIVTTMYAMDMIPDSRLRFVIFSQILAMLLSAFLGCGQMLDGLGDLFRGRFSINSMIFFTFAACCTDAVLCLSELRVPCCAAFSLEITMAQWASYQKHSAEMAQMDSMRKAVRLYALVKEPDYYNGKSGILRRDGEVEDFMDRYNRPSGPEILRSIYCVLALLLCIGIAAFAGMMHGTAMAIQILATSLLVAVPASFFISLSRPAALLERRLHMVGSVICGWQGVKKLCGKAAFPLRDEDLFPVNTTKLNGVKFYGDRDPDEAVSYAASLISAAGGGLVTIFNNMLESRNGVLHSVENFRDYGSGGIGGEVCGEPVILGSLDFLQDMGIEIPEGIMVSQAVYAAIDGQLCAVFAISYAKMRSSAAGIVSLCANRKITPVLTGIDFMLTDTLLRTKFNVNTRRIAFPDQQIRSDLRVYSDDFELPALALVTRDDLAAYAYAVSGAQALRASCRLGVAIHLVGGILGMLIMAALAFLGTTDLLTPSHVLLYQLVWLIPGLLITEWTRTV